MPFQCSATETVGARSARSFAFEISIESPTALQLVALKHDTERSSITSSPCGPLLSGLGTIDHRVPSQCSTNGSEGVNPTATQLVVLVHDTPSRLVSTAKMVSPGAIFGLGAATIDHATPFHCSVSVPPADAPTAKQLAESTHDTASSPARFVSPPGVGLGKIVQLVPSHCSTNVREPVAVE